MQTECSADLFGFARVEGRAVVAGFDGGRMTSDAGAMLLGATDRAIGLIERFAGCFRDHRAAELVELLRDYRYFTSRDNLSDRWVSHRTTISYRGVSNEPRTCWLAPISHCRKLRLPQA